MFYIIRHNNLNWRCLLSKISSMRPGSSVAVIISCFADEIVKQKTISSIDDTESEDS